MPQPSQDDADIATVLDFLACRTMPEWQTAAVAQLEVVLLDHATLEFKAAQQAQKLIWRYGAGPAIGRNALEDSVRQRLLIGMSRLAREELRHFEQVVALLERRGSVYRPLRPSRYATGLHAHIRTTEPDRLLDTLIVGALIEARSCERFGCLARAVAAVEPELARFYGSLLRAESRHFTDYLSLAQSVGAASLPERLAFFCAVEGELISSYDPEIRFHSGVPR